MAPRVLLLHNRYREPGGEERLVDQMQRLISARGGECHLLVRESRGLSRTKAGFSLLSGGSQSGEVAEAVERFGVGIVHAHNINPLFGPRALVAAREVGARVVMHLHNFRIFCAIGTCYRDGRPCFLCKGRRTFPGLRHRCRRSVVESAVYSTALGFHQPALMEAVDLFVVPSSFAQKQLERMGLPPGKSAVLNNFLLDDEFTAESAADTGLYALFVGRLSEEKGIETTIAAAKQAKVPLKVAGGGSDSDKYSALAGGDSQIEFLGPVGRQELHSLRKQAAFAVVPSRGPEVFPFVAMEAMAAGLPTLVSKRGGLPEMVDSNQSVQPADVAAWADAMDRLWRSSEERKALGEANLGRARKDFGADAFFERLTEVYGDVLGRRVLR